MKRERKKNHTHRWFWQHQHSDTTEAWTEETQSSCRVADEATSDEILEFKTRKYFFIYIFFCLSQTCLLVPTQQNYCTYLEFRGNFAVFVIRVTSVYVHSVQLSKVPEFFFYHSSSKIFVNERRRRQGKKQVRTSGKINWKCLVYNNNIFVCGFHPIHTNIDFYPFSSIFIIISI